MLWKIMIIIALALSAWSAWASWQNTFVISKIMETISRIMDVINDTLRVSFEKQGR